MKKILLGCSALVLLAACDPATVTSTDSGASTTTETTAMADIGTWGFDVDGMDASYHPGDDFFRYANGTWLDNTTIPEDRSNYGMFTELALEAIGAYAQPYVEDTLIQSNEPDVGPSYAKTIAPYYFSVRKTSIFAGSNEVQRNIMAKAVLGL